MSVMIKVITCIKKLPVETAETSATLAKRPVIIRSTAPYIVCNNIAHSTGKAKRSKGVSIFPSVKSQTSFMFLLYSKKLKSSTSQKKRGQNCTKIMQNAANPGKNKKKIPVIDKIMQKRYINIHYDKEAVDNSLFKGLLSTAFSFFPKPCKKKRGIEVRRCRTQ